MTVLERNLLKTISDNLTKSMFTAWGRGGLDDWAEHAKTMKIAIKNSAAMLETLLSTEKNPSELETPIKPDNINGEN